MLGASGKYSKCSNKHKSKIQNTGKIHLENINSDDLSWWAPPRKCWERESVRLPDGFQVAISSLCGPGERYRVGDDLWENMRQIQNRYEMASKSNLRKWECERIRSQPTRFFPESLGGTPWTCWSSWSPWSSSSSWSPCWPSSPWSARSPWRVPAPKALASPEVHELRNAHQPLD